ncbi:putative ATPase [Candidatus Sulfopaludibacter sp. SbA4]|nr:putative ATPase [Candidatus Sulfopaludibacter sp. SbA4]
MFKHLSVDGFRRLCGVELDLRPLCVLIGANGSGKTSLLDVFSLLAASAQGKLDEKISELGGLAEILTAGRAERLSLGLSMELHGRAPLQYDLAIVPIGAAYKIEIETLTQQRARPPFGLSKHIDSHGTKIRYYEIEEKTFKRPTWEHDHAETSLAQVPKMLKGPEDLRQRLASSTFYHALDVGPGSRVRLPQRMRPAKLPGQNGEDLISCLYSMRETDPDRFEAVRDGLRAAFPGFERLDFPPVAAGTLAMIWRDSDFREGFYTHQLSEGMLRFLWLATLLQSPALTAVTLIDEPEVSLHPGLLSLLADLLREGSLRSQIIVATHSDRLVRFLRPEEVVVVDMTDDGLAKLTWADQLDLDRWLDEYTLDEVWRMGRLGERA